MAAVYKRTMSPSIGKWHESADGPLPPRPQLRAALPPGEARSWARLEHPHIVPSTRCGIENGLRGGMRLIRGPLSSLLAGSPADCRGGPSLLRDVAEALHYAHGKGIITPRRQAPQVCWTRVAALPGGPSGSRDNARRIDAPDATAPSRDPAYMVPSKPPARSGRALRRLRPRIVAYETPRGRVRLGDDADVGPDEAGFRAGAAPPPSEVSATLTAVLHKCLAKDRDDRWTTRWPSRGARTRPQGGGHGARDSVLPTTRSITTPVTERSEAIPTAPRGRGRIGRRRLDRRRGGHPRRRAGDGAEGGRPLRSKSTASHRAHTSTGDHTVTRGWTDPEDRNQRIAYGAAARPGWRSSQPPAILIAQCADAGRRGETQTHGLRARTCVL